MKTIHEWLKELPQDIYERALAYKPKYAVKWKEKKDSLWSALISAFLWSETAEGNSFWHFVANGEYDKARALLKPDHNLTHALNRLSKQIYMANKAKGF